MMIKLVKMNLIIYLIRIVSLCGGIVSLYDFLNLEMSNTQSLFLISSKYYVCACLYACTILEYVNKRNSFLSMTHQFHVFLTNIKLSYFLYPIISIYDFPFSNHRLTLIIFIHYIFNNVDILIFRKRPTTNRLIYLLCLISLLCYLNQNADVFTVMLLWMLCITEFMQKIIGFFINSYHSGNFIYGFVRSLFCWFIILHCYQINRLTSFPFMISLIILIEGIRRINKL